jgi:phosphatidylethanolamine-binding protein (PEBP) family uncharacterized protein
VESPALPNNVVAPYLPRKYTCNGADIPPPLRFNKIPHGTHEIAVIILDTEPIHKKLSINWIATGINPNLHELNPNKLPATITISPNSEGQRRYTICPPPGPPQEYFITIFTLPRHITLNPRHNANTTRKQILRSAASQYLLSFSSQHH